jgi:octanoyl-[GcvH]:protein N-octanoyltransferase
MPGRLRLDLTSLAGAPERDTAVARALLHRVDAGELPATLRLARPRRVVAFSGRDAASPGFRSAVAAAAAHGFGAVLRLAGGRAAVFTPATLSFSLAEPADPPREGIEARFAAMAGRLRDALGAIGVDARIGEVPGEYCPGAWSVNARGRVKIAGIGQRLLRRAAHTGGVVVVDDAPAIRGVLRDVQAAMDLGWEPATVGAAADEVAGLAWETVRDAVVDAFAVDHDLEPWALDEATLDLADRFAPEHLPGARPSSARELRKTVGPPR